MNAIIHNGLSSMLQSQQAMQQSAHHIARAKPSLEPTEGSTSNGHNTAPSKTDTPLTTDAALAHDAVNAPNDPSGANRAGEFSNGALPVNQSAYNHAQELINLQQQKQLFTASASMVKVGVDAVGSLIDDYS
ncbi:hypothetical protein [Marinagarivorans algicola]|uniref:hypothetical protein n=1 Tax=Marinagarivorans algicola TaxID=1513270 RepID=UPI0006B6043E|nr:hypothetical protein [Marinagarivorans algicola]